MHNVGFPALLGLLFIGLKLTGYIAWSWLWVLSPFWIPLAVFLFAMLCVGVVALIAVFFGGKTVKLSRSKR